MQIIAFVLALIAVFCFAVAAYVGIPTNPPRRSWHLGWLGLAFLTVAWMVQVIVLSGGRVSVK
jgi:NADH:ubiquinone oxidoreductase subunit 6 (subunit J)